MGRKIPGSLFPTRRRPDALRLHVGLTGARASATHRGLRLARVPVGVPPSEAKTNGKPAEELPKDVDKK